MNETTGTKGADVILIGTVRLGPAPRQYLTALWDNEEDDAAFDALSEESFAEDWGAGPDAVYDEEKP